MADPKERSLPWRGADARKSHDPGYDEEVDAADYSAIEEDYGTPQPGPDGPNWNDDAEGYGDPRHGRPAPAPAAHTLPVPVASGHSRPGSKGI